jgi:hypothetical protein
VQRSTLHVFTQLTWGLLCTLIVSACGSGRPIYLGPPAEELEPAPPASAPSGPSASGPSKQKVPDQLGTPAQSRAAAPQWWLSETIFGFGKQPGYAPEMPTWERGVVKALENDADVSGFHPTLSRQTLVCWVAVDYSENRTLLYRYNKADLVVAATFGEGRSIVSHGPEDAGQASFVLPLVELKQGEALTLGIADRNFLSFVKIGKENFSYGGNLPWAFKGKTMRGECRGVSRNLMERRLNELAAKSDGDLRKQDGCKPNPRMQRFGRDCLTKSLTRMRFQALAALVGWDDPRVKRRVARDLEQRETFQRELTTALSKEWENAAGTDRVETPGILIRPVKQTCGLNTLKGLRVVGGPSEPGALCELVVEVTNRTGAPIEVWSDQIGAVRNPVVFDIRGNASRAEWVGWQGPNGRTDLSQARTLGAAEKRILVGWYHTGPAPPEVMLRIEPEHERAMLIRIPSP